MAVTSVSGTALQIDVANGTTTPVVSIDPGYEGQASIDTVGTITTGIWNAGKITTDGTISLPDTTATSAGVLKLNSHPFLHTGYFSLSLQNTFLGIDSGSIGSSFSGSQNVGAGYNALAALTSGSSTVAIGAFAGRGIDTGHDNVLIGLEAGTNYTGSESSNILIGSGVFGAAGDSHQLQIGASTGNTGDGAINKAIICGINGKTSTSGVSVLINSSDVLGTTTSSRRFKRNIEDMGENSSRIRGLRPVTFLYNTDIEGATDEMKYGLIAEEVIETMPELVVVDKEGLPETVRYQDLPALLLNELQKVIKRLDQIEARAI